MGKSTHFFGQPVYGQLIKSLDREKIIELSRKNGGEKYIKSFTGFTHLLTMLYAVIMRFDSLREIEAAMTAEVRKLWWRAPSKPEGGLRTLRVGGSEAALGRSAPGAPPTPAGEPDFL